MVAFNGRWGHIESNGAAAYFVAIKTPEDYKNKTLEMVDSLKNDPNAYAEFRTTATAINRLTVVNGETKWESGVITLGVETDAKSFDGRPAKVTMERISDTKITVSETGDGFGTVITFEVSGNTLTMTANADGSKCVAKFKKL